jgi:hypothetical protein
LRDVLLSIAFAAAVLGIRSEVSACDRCAQLGLPAHDYVHGHFAAGDNYDDAFTPSAPLEEGMASAQFVLQGGRFPQPGGLGTSVSITYSFNNLLDGGLKDINGVSLPAALIRDSIEEAFGVWARYAPLHFVEVADEGGWEPTLADYPDGQFGEIRFSHLYYNGPDIPGQPPTTKALAFFNGSGGPNLSADIFFDNSDPWQEAGTLPRPDVLGAAIHEIGHTLGLGHSTDPIANMYWIFRRFSGLGTGDLSADDIAGIQERYGAGVGSVTPLVPEPSTVTIGIVVVFGLFALSSRRRAVQ